MRKFLALLVLFSSVHGFASAQCKINYSNYNLVFEENFNNITSISQLTNYWQFVHDDPGWGWGDYTNPTTNQTTYGEYYAPSQVSIQPGGYLRLTATKLPAPQAVYSTYLNANRYPIYKSGMIQLRNDLTGYPFDVVNGVSGFAYGMFELRVKLPVNNECFAAFWLTRAGQSTEIDFFEYGGGNTISNNVIDFSRPKPSDGCQNQFTKRGGANLNEQFHTISCVWTPEKVTFFFDGKETRTVSKTQQKTYNYPLSIVVNLGMNAWHSTASNYMDIDYIRVYKPNSGNYNNSYKNQYESVAFDIFKNATGSFLPVNSAPNSIAPNTANPNEVFYRGTDNYIYVANKGLNGTWNIKKLLFNDGAPVLANGDVRYLPQHDVLLYVGSNNRINMFARNSTPEGFYHWYLTSNWNCYWCVSDDLVSSTPGSLQVAPNGAVFFKGTDLKMHRYYHNGLNWVHQILPSTYSSSNPADFVGGDITIENHGNDNTIYYKGLDKRVQIFYLNNGNYIHDWIDNNYSLTDKLVNDKIGSMSWSPALNGVVYTGQDKKLKLFYWDVTWKHMVIPYTYNSPTLGYPGADYLNGNISWNNNDKTLYYVGDDGRAQIFANGNSRTQWTHYWLDDFWNTDLFQSYNSSQTSKYSSIINNRSTAAGRTFYSTKDGNLAYFEYTACENLNPLCNDNNSSNFRTLLNDKKKLELNKKQSAISAKIDVFPNPAQDFVTLSTNDYSLPLAINFIDALGRNVLIKTDAYNGDKIDISTLSPGIYFVVITNNEVHKRIKIIVN